jgi:hypothetical protein
VKIPQMSAGALLFARADVSPAKQVVTRSYTPEQINETMRLPESERPYYTPGYPTGTPLLHGQRISSLDGPGNAPTGANPPPPYVSDTGELAWNLEPGKRGLVTIDTPRSQALVGFIKANAGKTTKHLLAEIKNEFAAITLSSLTDLPIQRSNRLLLTATSRWENTGAVWNERRSLQSNMGHEPTLIEPVTGWLLLRELDGAVGVKLIPLDGAAKPIGEPIAGRRLEDGWEVPLGTPVTAHYLIEITR